jgi:hypothetical protein
MQVNVPPARPWPNMREGLLELYVILDEWCSAAAESNKAVHQVLKARRAARGMNTTGPLTIKMPMASNAGSSGYIKVRLKDTESILSPAVPLLQRPRGTVRRAAARRSLRNLMRVYCPDLLEQFEESVRKRSDWVTTNRRELTALLENPRGAIRRLEQMALEMDSTLTKLWKARSLLRNLIQEKFPLGDDQPATRT